MAAKLEEIIRERTLGGSEKGLEEVLLLQLISNPQGIDQNILPYLVLLLGPGRGRLDKFALVTLLISQQQAQAQAATASGAPPPTTSNILPLLLAFGLFGEEREREERYVDVRELKKAT